MKNFGKEYVSNVNQDITNHGIDIYGIMLSVYLAIKEGDMLMLTMLLACVIKIRGLFRYQTNIMRMNSVNVLKIGL